MTDSQRFIQYDEEMQINEPHESDEEFLDYEFPRRKPAGPVAIAKVSARRLFPIFRYSPPRRS